MNNLKRLVLVGTCATLLGGTLQAQTNPCCGFLHVCEMIFNLGAGAGVAACPGTAAFFDPLALPLRCVGIALFIRGFRQFCSCVCGNGKDEQLNNLQKRVHESEKRNRKTENTLAELQREMDKIKNTS